MRRLVAHVSALPADSAFMRSVLGEASGWDQRAELLASVIDELRANTYYLLRVNGNDDLEWPTPYRRPGQAPAEPDMVALSELPSFLIALEE